MTLTWAPVPHKPDTFVAEAGPLTFTLTQSNGRWAGTVHWYRVEILNHDFIPAIKEDPWGPLEAVVDLEEAQVTLARRFGAHLHAMTEALASRGITPGPLWVTANPTTLTPR